MRYGDAPAGAHGGAGGRADEPVLAAPLGHGSVDRVPGLVPLQHGEALEGTGTTAAALQGLRLRMWWPAESGFEGWFYGHLKERRAEEREVGEAPGAVEVEYDDGTLATHWLPRECFQWMNPRTAGDVSGHQLVGRRVAVRWGPENYYEGSVTDVALPHATVVRVCYDDGDFEWLSLQNATVRWLNNAPPKPGERERPVVVDASPVPAPKRKRPKDKATGKRKRATSPRAQVTAARPNAPRPPAAQQMPPAHLQQAARTTAAPPAALPAPGPELTSGLFGAAGDFLWRGPEPGSNAVSAELLAQLL